MSKVNLKPGGNPRVRVLSAVLEAHVSPREVSRDAPHPSLKRWPEGGLKVSSGVPQVTQDSSLTQGVFFTPQVPSVCWLLRVAV